MQERIRHEDQRPMFLNGFGTAHAILVEPQMGLTVLIKGFNWPTLQIQSNDPLGVPIDAIRHQHDIRAGQLRAFEAHYQADFAEPGKAHGQGKGPVRFVPYSYRPVGGGRDAWDEVFYRNMGSLQGDGFPRSVLEREAVGLEIPVLL